MESRDAELEQLRQDKLALESVEKNQDLIEN